MRWKKHRCHPPANQWSLSVPSVGSSSRPHRAEPVTWNAVLWRWMCLLICFFRQCSCSWPHLVMQLLSVLGKLVGKKKMLFASFYLRGAGGAVNARLTHTLGKPWAQSSSSRAMIQYQVRRMWQSVGEFILISLRRDQVVDDFKSQQAGAEWGVNKVVSTCSGLSEWFVLCEAIA